jgi:hypothetical protein
MKYEHQREIWRKCSKKYYWKNRDQQLATNKRWRKSNPRTNTLRIMGYEFQKQKKLRKELREIFKEVGIKDLDMIRTKLEVD